ncbi:MAG: hypothetical protein M0033_10230 [Nitrospiraceae bacterium]|nr:hypothetical protein [Nitrospiraceae bacterium]
MGYLYRIRTPVEYSFHVWISNFPDSRHPHDKDRFLAFVKTVCRYDRKKWKNSNYLEERILKVKPRFDPYYLQYLLQLYHDLLNFYKMPPIRHHGIDNGSQSVKEGFYIEIEIKNGKVYERELPIEFPGHEDN